MNRRLLLLTLTLNLKLNTQRIKNFLSLVTAWTFIVTAIYQIHHIHKPPYTSINYRKLKPIHTIPKPISNYLRSLSERSRSKVQNKANTHTNVARNSMVYVSAIEQGTKSRSDFLQSGPALAERAGQHLAIHFSRSNACTLPARGRFNYNETCRLT